MLLLTCGIDKDLNLSSFVQQKTRLCLTGNDFSLATNPQSGLTISTPGASGSLFIIVSRRKAITQVIGSLMLENAIALVAVVGTYGVPVLVEFGVFLDALMGFLVMQIFVYQIHETFDTIDVEQLTRLRH